MKEVVVSIIIRTYNEARHLNEVLEAIAVQERGEAELEVVLVDSGSTDGTLDIASKHGCRIEHIRKEDFSFGRSLNVGCEAAHGDYLVFVSGHCIPGNSDWVRNLIKPLVDGKAHYSYGRQGGNHLNKFSECRLFAKNFPEVSCIPQKGYFCNNGNAAIKRASWESHRFSEDLTGLEDMDLGQRLLENGMKVAYVAEAPIIHIHEESWWQIKTRFEREAIGLQKIMPQVHISFSDFLRYFLSAVALDMRAALHEQKLWGVVFEICAFRFMQFWGSYCGNNEHRRLSREMKEKYFYPR
jgi:glycosyltransferase involved in cell wall biosynthesis